MFANKAATMIRMVFIFRLLIGYRRFHEGCNVSGNGKEKLTSGSHAFLEMLTDELEETLTMQLRKSVRSLS